MQASFLKEQSHFLTQVPKVKVTNCYIKTVFSKFAVPSFHNQEKALNTVLDAQFFPGMTQVFRIYDEKPLLCHFFILALPLKHKIPNFG